MGEPLRIIAPTSIYGLFWDGRGYLCLNHIARLAGRRVRVADWLRNRTTLEYLAAWERSHNHVFNEGEFALIRDMHMEGYYVAHRLSVHQWVEATAAVGVRALRGRHGGTYAVLDIAMHFARWVTPIPLQPVRKGSITRNQVWDVQYAIRDIVDYFAKS